MGIAFIIVDMLNDFIDPKGKLYFPDGAGVVEPIARLKASFRSAGLPVVYDNDAHPEDSQEFATWPPHCIRGDWGSAVVPDLTVEPDDVVYQKDALSLFADGKAEQVLHDLGATRLYVAGVATEYCVHACVVDALARGFSVTVVENAIAGVEMHKGDIARAMMAMHRAGAEFTRTERLVAALPGGRGRKM